MDNDRQKKDVTLRLKRIEGQIRGLQRMVEEGVSGPDILTQVAAATAALKKVGTVIIHTGGRQLPYLDGLVLEIVPDQNAEMLRLEAGQADLTTGEVRPDDLAAVRKAAADGQLALHDLGVGLDPDSLWFNLTGEIKRRQPQKSWMQRRAFREAVSLAVDREAFANTAYLGGGVPVSGPVTPGNRFWYDPSIPVVPYDTARARELLVEIGPRDRDGNGMLDTPAGLPAGFPLLTQKGNTLRERARRSSRRISGRWDWPWTWSPSSFRR